MEDGKHRPPAVRRHPKSSSDLAYVIKVLLEDVPLEKHGYRYDVKLNKVGCDFAVEFSEALARMLKKG